MNELASVSLGNELEAVVARNGDGDLVLRVRRIGGAVGPASGRLWVWWSDTRPRTAELPGGFLVFGEMLAGSAVVELRPSVPHRKSVVARGVYMMLLDEEPPDREIFVVFRDEIGSIVPWPHPAVLKRCRATDRDESCPACGSREWDTVEIRTEPEVEHYRHRGSVCSACGLQHGGWTAVGPRRREFRAARALEPSRRRLVLRRPRPWPAAPSSPSEQPVGVLSL